VAGELVIGLGPEELARLRLSPEWAKLCLERAERDLDLAKSMQQMNAHNDFVREFMA
jgi:hypothetical protein